MNPVTNLVTIISLLLALAGAGNAPKGQGVVSSSSVTNVTPSRPFPGGGGCDEWYCGGNHNETMVLDAEPM